MNRMSDEPSEQVRSKILAERSQDLLIRWAGRVRAPDAYRQPYVGQGSALNAIVLQEAAVAQSRAEYIDAAAAHLSHGVQLLEELPLSSSLYRGVAGLGWTLQTFAKPELLPWRDEVLGDLDELLADGLEVTGNLNIDIVNGLAGIAVYAVARGNGGESSAGLWEVLDRKISEYLVQWRFAVDERQTAENAANNLGVAHGVPGLLAVAAAACARGLLPSATSTLVVSGMSALWNAAIDDGGRVSFPNRYAETKSSRLAWCYGGLGLAATFRNAIAIDAANVERYRKICESSVAQYEAGTHGIRDASLCHGHAGAALSFAHLAQGDWLDEQTSTSLHDAALRACAAALDSEVHGEGGSVFMHAGRTGMAPSLNFLEGGPGVALSLQAMFAQHTPAWMNLLGYY